MFCFLLLFLLHDKIAVKMKQCACHKGGKMRGYPRPRSFLASRPLLLEVYAQANSTERVSSTIDLFGQRAECQENKQFYEQTSPTSHKMENILICLLARSIWSKGKVRLPRYIYISRWALNYVYRRYCGVNDERTNPGGGGEGTP